MNFWYFLTFIHIILNCNKIQIYKVNMVPVLNSTNEKIKIVFVWVVFINVILVIGNFYVFSDIYPRLKRKGLT